MLGLVRRCHYCLKDITREVTPQSYLENPFCEQCRSERLKKANLEMQSPDELMELRASIERSGLELCCCMGCGESFVCVPDGLVLCEACAAKCEKELHNQETTNVDT